MGGLWPGLGGGEVCGGNCNGKGKVEDNSRSSAIPPQRAKTARRGPRFGEGWQLKDKGNSNCNRRSPPG